MTLQCCVCKKVKEQGSWKFEDRTARADASHTYCPPCLKSSIAAMKAERHRADMARPVGA